MFCFVSLFFISFLNIYSFFSSLFVCLFWCTLCCGTKNRNRYDLAKINFVFFLLCFSFTPPTQPLFGNIIHVCCFSFVAANMSSFYLRLLFLFLSLSLSLAHKRKLDRNNNHSLASKRKSPCPSRWYSIRLRIRTSPSSLAQRAQNNSINKRERFLKNIQHNTTQLKRRHTSRQTSRQSDGNWRPEESKESSVSVVVVDGGGGSGGHNSGNDDGVGVGIGSTADRVQHGLSCRVVRLGGRGQELAGASLRAQHVQGQLRADD